MWDILVSSECEKAELVSLYQGPKTKSTHERNSKASNKHAIENMKVN